MLRGVPVRRNAAGAPVQWRCRKRVAGLRIQIPDGFPARKTYKIRPLVRGLASNTVGVKIMLEWAREVMHRLLQDQNTSLGTGKGPEGLTRNEQGRTREGFDRFLQEFEANNDESLHQHPGGKQAA